MDAMIIVQDVNTFEYSGRMAVTIGKFDGFHLGHDEIARRLSKYKDKGYDLGVVTFRESPLPILHGEKDYKVLTTNDEKKIIFEQMGFDYYIELPFDESIRCLEARDFAEEILIGKLNMRACVLGVDLRFGYRGAGDSSLLKEIGAEHGIDVEVIDKVTYLGDVVSSTLIRKLIETGDVKKAACLLKVPYHIYGQVAHGREIGRTISIPTVNLIPSADKLLPPFGVYVSETEYAGIKYKSVTDIGCKPTISGDKPEVSVETYIIDFDRQIYGEYITVALLERIRDEIKFDSIEALKTQMNRDIEYTEKYYVNQA